MSQTLLDITDEERSTKNFFSSLTFNQDGNEVLRGLTRSESEWMLEYDIKHPILGRVVHASQEDREKWVELQGRHEVARLQAIASEIVAK